MGFNEGHVLVQVVRPLVHPSEVQSALGALQICLAQVARNAWEAHRICLVLAVHRSSLEAHRICLVLEVLKNGQVVRLSLEVLKPPLLHLRTLLHSGGIHCRFL